MATTKKPNPSRLFDDNDEDDSSGSDSSSQEDKTSFQINKKFATAYEKRKQKEELARARFDDDYNSSSENSSGNSSNSSSSEDEDAELLTTVVDVDIMKTIRALRTKDERIYDPTVRFFEKTTTTAASDDDDDDDDDDDNENGESYKEKQTFANKKHKPKRYKDVVREEILEKMERGSDDEATNDDDDTEDVNRDEKTSRLAYDEEQREIRKAFLMSTKDKQGKENVDDDDDDSSDGLMEIKTKGRTHDDDNNKNDDDDSEEAQKALEQEIEKLKSTGNATTLVDPRGEIQDGEGFLLDFFKNRSWKDPDEEDDDDEDDDSGDDSDEGVASSKQHITKSDNGNDDDDASLEDLDKADDFEAQYNFRFEQAANSTATGADFSIMSYARGQTMNTLRREDQTRRDKRLARKERKAAERQQKEEQLRRLKNAKRQEMNDKLRKIKSVLGEVEDLGGGVDEETLLKLMEGDFDPEKFEELMKETYGDDFYQRVDVQWKSDQDVRAALKNDEDGALLVGQDDADGGLYDNDEETDENNDQDQTMDDEEDAGVPEEDEYYEDDEVEKPASKMEQTIKGKMMDELYKLDYEDIVAGIPTRFKYRQVEPNNYGLSTEEILFARDTTLKQFVSLKKMAPYREDGEFFVGSKKRRHFREILKKDLEEITEQNGTSQQKQDEIEQHKEDDTSGESKKKRRRKRGKKKGLSTPKNDNDDTGEEDVTRIEKGPDTVATMEPKSKRRRRKESSVQSETGALSAEEKEKAITKQSNVVETMKDTVAEEKQKQSKETKKRKKKKEKSKRKTKTGIDGVSAARMASYGL